MTHRKVIFDILVRGTKGYFKEIDEAKSRQERDEAISRLRDALQLIKTKFGMPDDVYELYLQECIRNHELVDWDEWLPRRLMDMNDLPHKMQQSLLNYALKRLALLQDEERENKS